MKIPLIIFLTFPIALNACFKEKNSEYYYKKIATKRVNAAQDSLFKIAKQSQEEAKEFLWPNFLDNHVILLYNFYVEKLRDIYKKALQDISVVDLQKISKALNAENTKPENIPSLELLLTREKEFFLPIKNSIKHSLETYAKKLVDVELKEAESSLIEDSLAMNSQLSRLEESTIDSNEKSGLIELFNLSILATDACLNKTSTLLKNHDPHK